MERSVRAIEKMANIDAFKLKTWEERGGEYVRRLASDLGLRDFQAAGLVGNLGAETEGFALMQEMQPQVAGSRGGYGVAQWTGSRRRNFEAWCAEHLLRPEQDEANYGFLLYELNGAYIGFLRQLRKSASVAEATKLTHKLYETPQDVLDGTYQSYPKRLKYAERALTGTPATPAEGSPKPIRAVESAITASNKTTMRLQQRLDEAGFYRGEIDGDLGPQTRTALLAYLQLHHPE